MIVYEHLTIINIQKQSHDENVVSAGYLEGIPECGVSNWMFTL
jgi:hypothetical protein